MEVLDALERGDCHLEQVSETGHRLTLCSGRVLYLRICRGPEHYSRESSCHCPAISREAAIYKALAVTQGFLVPRLLLSAGTIINGMRNAPLSQTQAAFYIREWIDEALEHLPSDPHQGHPTTWDPQTLEEAFDSTRNILSSLSSDILGLH